MKNNKIIKVLSLVLVVMFMLTTMGQGAVSAYSGQEGTAGHGGFIMPNPRPNPKPNPNPNPPNAPLRAFISGPRTLIPYQSASYSVYVEGGMPPYTYRWSNGCTKPSASYVWHSKGNYTVTVTVTDSNKKTTKAQLNVKVGNDNPVPIPPEPPSSSFQIPDLQQLLKTWSPGKLYDLSNGFKGILVPSFDKKYYMYVFKPDTGKLMLYMYDSNNWVLSKVINTIKGFEKPMAVKRYKYSIWNDYSGNNNMGDDWSTKEVTNGSLEIELSGPKKTSVNKQETYTVAINKGTSPFKISWSENGFVNSFNSDKNAHYKWNKDGDYVVTVMVKDAKGNSAIASIDITVINPLSVSISGPDTLKVNEQGNYTATIQGGTPPYTFIWSMDGIPWGYQKVSNNTTHTFQVLRTVPGTITLGFNVTDSTGKTASASKDVKVVSSLKVTVSGKTHVEFVEGWVSTGSNEEIDTYTAHITGGTSPYTLSWNQNNFLLNQNGTTARYRWTSSNCGIHTVKVTVVDANGQSAVGSLKVHITKDRIDPPDPPKPPDNNNNVDSEGDGKAWPQVGHYGSGPGAGKDVPGSPNYDPDDPLSGTK